MTNVVARKLVIVGDGSVGKTCLLLRYAKGEFQTAYIPTVFDSTIVDITIDDVDIELSLWDTAGQEDYDRLRPLSYTDTSVVLIAFSVVRPDTLKNVHLKWKDEVQHFCPSAPILLIGTKSDLRESSTEPTVSPEEAKAAAAAIGAASYIECSALSDVNVNTVFQTAARAALEGVERAPSKRKCSLL
ncbi:uncharacterized protein AMSG_01820 [Thecamonas trahens ATCC 50062]|uniref:Uncharacterized protein n=1 Tax=Thecamonas trahens ATCC 50062 TaxID=461836 RepID=A0A0L0DTK5_THETB|nr:hypothetical protein AMSG_01820 [Thecamonas trahens ATCC 50062]KNC55557.1 hypothetical protein AMSG_01820 [Thecamonas trahens ATCC 50062]|eukprot:XP_013761331.1 hypothetical protein AMSG_01820 [Thecamonas trahens ATCC 50062]